MPFLLPNIVDLMHFSLEELVRKFNVSPKELRKLATKLEKETPEDKEKDEDEKTFKEYYNKIWNRKKRKL